MTVIHRLVDELRQLITFAEIGGSAALARRRAT